MDFEGNAKQQLRDKKKRKCSAAPKIPGDFGFAEEYGFDTSKIRIGKSEDLVDFEGDAKQQLRDKKKRRGTEP